MGCDIHFYVEKKDDTGKWVSADGWTRDEGDDRQRVDYKARFYHERNYDLFGMLANVRNGRGFAGVKTGDGFAPITGEETRGMPEDVSPEVKAECESWSGDGHSHQWLTLAELLPYDWTQVTKHRGIVDLSEYLRWQSSYEMKYEGACSPRSWCGASHGRDILNLPEEEIKRLADHARAEGKRSDEDLAAYIGFIHSGKMIGVRAEWETPYYHSVRQFFGTTIPRLLALSGGDYESVRCVFWFDN